MADEFFALPAFKPADALVQLKRTLRDLHLTERGTTFELKGRTVIELSTDATSIQARLAKRPALAPEWQSFALKAGPDVRKFTDEVKRRVTAWGHEDT